MSRNIIDQKEVRFMVFPEYAAGAFLAAPLIAVATITTPMVAGAGLKIVYDVALWVACR